MINAKFKDSPLGPIPQDWELKRLGEVCEKIGSGATPTGGATNYCKTGIALIRSQNVLDGRFAFGGLAYINEIQASELDNVEVQSKDVLLNITGDSVARACIVSDLALPARVNQHVCIIRVVSKLCNPLYLSGRLVAEKKRLLAAAFGGGTRNALTKADVEAFQIAIPPLSEQRRIAEALGEMDRLIELLDAQIEKKHRIAQGLAHDLLGTGNGEQGTGNGECGMRNEPIRRLPGFKGEWVKKRLGEMLTLGHGKDYKGLTNGDVPVYGTGGLMCFVNEYLYDGPTVCIGRKGTIDAPIYHEGKIWTVDTLFYSHSFIDADPKFIYYTFCSIDWKSFNEASGVPSLSSMIIEGIEVFVPPTIAEQRAIAEVLAAADDGIAALETKRDKYMRIKEGMMRDLLTGKVRI